MPFKRVANGRQQDEFDNRPWTAYLKKGSKRVHCGATLVAANWVVTAASCLKEPINAVILGDDDITYDEGTEQTMEIAETVIHPDYNPKRLDHDIALIRLTAAVELTDEVSPIPIMSSDSTIMKGIDEEYIMGKHCRIAGWGQPKCLNINKFANFMKEMVVDRVNDTDCDLETEDRPSTALCFHPYRRPDLASLCDGDAGGPYICKIRRVWHLVGVISTWNVQETCSAGIKGATKIVGYAPWIHSHIGMAAEPEPLPIDPGMITTPIIDPVRKTTTAPTVAPEPITTTQAAVTNAPATMGTTAAAATVAEAATTQATEAAADTAAPMATAAVADTGAPTATAAVADTGAPTAGAAEATTAATAAANTAAATEAAAAATNLVTVPVLDGNVNVEQANQ